MTDPRVTLDRPRPAHESRASASAVGFDRYPDAVFSPGRRFDVPSVDEDDLRLDADTAWARRHVDGWSPWPELDEEWPVSHDLGAAGPVAMGWAAPEALLPDSPALDASAAGTATPEPTAPEFPALDASAAETATPEPTAPDSPDAHLTALQAVAVERRRATAEEYRLIALILDDAVARPQPWVGQDPTLDLAWDDTRGRSVAAVRRDRLDMAERAAVAEIAVRLRVSEQTVGFARARPARCRSAVPCRGRRSSTVARPSVTRSRRLVSPRPSPTTIPRRGRRSTSAPPTVRHD